ncbi:phage tail protein [Helicobacter salomonis]|uniref:phage tail protein n=1 Tax=Helicobacter salomonis TaxID=56878 RepID=UPI000CF065B8|nr:phage tail protein [Helicobacter salomonis]
MSVLPNTFGPEIRALDVAFKRLIKAHFQAPFHYFYNPVDNPHLIAMARCFGVDLDTNLPLYQQHAQLDKPLLKKIHLGTERGIEEACTKVFGPVQLITYANQDTHPNAPKTRLKLQPFEYQVRIEPSVRSVLDVKRAIASIKQIQPARDRFKRLLVDFPQVDMSLRLISGASLRARFNDRLKFSRTFNPPLNWHSRGRFNFSLHKHVRYNTTQLVPLSVVVAHHLSLNIQTRSMP